MATGINTEPLATGRKRRCQVTKYRRLAPSLRGATVYSYRVAIHRTNHWSRTPGRAGGSGHPCPVSCETVPAGVHARPDPIRASDRAAQGPSRVAVDERGHHTHTSHGDQHEVLTRSSVVWYEKFGRASQGTTCDDNSPRIWFLFFWKNIRYATRTALYRDQYRSVPSHMLNDLVD